MITALDTSVLVALWDLDEKLNHAAQIALDAAFERGGLVISGAVFAELLAFPRRNEKFLDEFLHDTGISVDWFTDESVWRTAAKALQGYSWRRRARTVTGPRRLLADFLIGAHALERGYDLLTLDQRLYRAVFPQLRITRV